MGRPYGLSANYRRLERKYGAFRTKQACGDKQVSSSFRNAGKCRQAFGNLLPVRAMPDREGGRVTYPPLHWLAMAGHSIHVVQADI
jgi:hypothetical protein